MSSLMFTTIQHSFRKKHGLSCNEYVLADMVYFLSTSPESRVTGWCYKSRSSMAEDLGVTKQSILNFVKTLEEKGFLEKDNQTSFIKTTKKWNQVYFTIGKESLPDGGKESLPDSGKKSLPYNNNIYNYNLDNNSFSFVEQKSDNPMTLHQKMCATWLSYHPDFIITGSSGKSLKEIKEKLCKLVKHRRGECDEDAAYDSFMFMLARLPDWYKDKDLPTINSKFNEIIEQIKNINNGQASTTKQSNYQSAKQAFGS